MILAHNLWKYCCKNKTITDQKARQEQSLLNYKGREHIQIDVTSWGFSTHGQYEDKILVQVDDGTTTNPFTCPTNLLQKQKCARKRCLFVSHSDVLNAEQCKQPWPVCHHNSNRVKTTRIIRTSKVFQIEVLFWCSSIYGSWLAASD